MRKMDNALCKVLRWIVTGSCCLFVCACYGVGNRNMHLAKKKVITMDAAKAPLAGLEVALKDGSNEVSKVTTNKDGVADFGEESLVNDGTSSAAVHDPKGIYEDKTENFISDGDETLTITMAPVPAPAAMVRKVRIEPAKAGVTLLLLEGGTVRSEVRTDDSGQATFTLDPSWKGSIAIAIGQSGTSLPLPSDEEEVIVVRDPQP